MEKGMCSHIDDLICFYVFGCLFCDCARAVKLDRIAEFRPHKPASELKPKAMIDGKVVSILITSEMPIDLLVWRRVPSS